MKKENFKKNVVVIIFFLIVSIFCIVNKNQYNNEIAGKVYFNKPVSWEKSYIYLCDENGEELFGEWPGKLLSLKEDYIFFVDITNKIGNDKDNKNFEIIFNDGQNYSVSENYEGYNKIYNITDGIGEKNYNNIGEWLDFSEELKIGKIPKISSKVKNVIYMIGDGMGENHILAGEIYKNESLNIQKIPNKSYVTTASLSTVTDSAAGATALATGKKTINGKIGKDKSGNNVENLIEYAMQKNKKTGIVCTQIINHATPAGFYVHNTERYNYNEIALAEINGNIDIILGGGRKYFSLYENQIMSNNYKWINDFNEIKKINKNTKIIGTFGEESLCKETNRVDLSDLTQEMLSRLENDNGFFAMIEGSDIDTYSHESNMDKMLNEMIQFDNAVKVAMDYVDNNPDTLLIVTADHETGGLKLENINSKEQLTNELFTSNGQHTNANVLIYAYGKGSEKISQYDIIDNTSIYSFVKQGM